MKKHPKTLKEITELVTDGFTVYWESCAYIVIDCKAGWCIKCPSTNNIQSLFWADGVNSSYKPESFFYMTDNQPPPNQHSQF